MPDALDLPGGPAFPVSIPGVGDNGCAGMSLRDYFAGIALSGLIANATYGGEIKRIFDMNKEVWERGEAGDGPREYVADIAYGLADAMLKSRK